MSWRSVVNLVLGFVLAASITGILVNHEQGNKIDKLQKQNRIQAELFYDLGCRTTRKGQLYCSTPGAF